MEWQRRKTARYGAAVDPLIAPEVVSRRVRAAAEYSGLSEDQIVKETGISRANWRRIVAGAKPRGFKTIEELWAVSRVCKVPHDFLLQGFPASENGDVEGRLAQVEEEQALVMEIIRQAVVPRLGEEETPRLLELLAEFDRAREERTRQPRNPRPPVA